MGGKERGEPVKLSVALTLAAGNRKYVGVQKLREMSKGVKYG